jgi:DNA-binding NarL/FixJ family response regulator
MGAGMIALHEGRSIHPVLTRLSRGFAESERPALPPRELEVLTLVCEGCTYKEIAHRLGISRHTILNHFHHIHAKLGVGTNIEAACWLVRQERGAD